MAKPIIVKRNRDTAEKYRYQYALVQPRQTGVWVARGLGVFVLFVLPILVWFFLQAKQPETPETPTEVVLTPEPLLAQAVTVWTESTRIEPHLDQPLALVMSPLQNASETEDLETTLQNQGQLRNPSAEMDSALPTIAKLLLKAQQQLLALRLTRPDDDNAYATYETLKTTCSSPVLAAGLLNAIATRYAGLIQETIDEERLEKTKRLLDSLNKLAPDYDQSFLKQNLLDKTLYLLEKQPVVPYGMQTFKFLENLETSAENLEKGRALVLANLEARVQQQLEKRRYTTPNGNNAQHSYQLMLQLDENNKIAQRGLKQLSKKYADLADKAMEQGAYSRARQMLQRGLSITPTDAHLLALKKQLKGNSSSNPKEKFSPEMYEDHIIAAIDAGNIDESLRLLKQGLKKYPNHPDLLNLKQAIEKGLAQ